MARVYGAKCDPDLDVAQIAKLIRADIKSASKRGIIPAGLKCTVQLKRSSMSASIDVRIVDGIDWQIVDLSQYKVDLWAGENYSPPLNNRTRALVATVKNIVSAYNHDGSDPMTDYHDVRFYGDTKLDWEYRERLETLQASEIEAIKAHYSKYQNKSLEVM